MATTFNPVLVIALGGTGTNTTRMLRERLQWRYGNIDQIPFVQFLFIDTDHNNEDAAGPDGILINPRPEQINRMMQAPEEFEHIGLKDWIDMEALSRADKGGFQQGAAGIRMFGRLALFASQGFQHMWNQIADRVSRVSSVTDSQIKQQLGIDQSEEVDVGPTRVYVISSACGGTGAGTFIDMGYIVHLIIHQEGLQAERIGILAIARQDATSERQFTRNTSALLSELDYYNRSGVVYDAKFPQHPPTQSRAACFNYCYLVSPSGPQAEIDFNDFLHRIAEYVYVDVIAQTQEAQSRRIDFGPDMAEFDMDGYPLRFLTFGVSSIEFPADVCHQACFHRTIYEFIERWLQCEDGRIAADGQTPLEPSEDDLTAVMHQLGIRTMRPERDSLLTELTEVPPELEDFAGGMRPQVWINEQISRTFEGELTAQAFSDLEYKLEAALGEDGYMTKCVEHNTKRLRNDRYLEHRMLDAVLPFAFDIEHGPRYALGIVEDLKQQLQDELQRIDAELRTARMPGYTLDDARKAIQTVRRDWLLRMPPLFGFRWINEHAARREMDNRRVMVADTYNRRAEEIVLCAKKQLYEELMDPAIETLRRRLAHLLEYLVAWHDEAVEAYQAIMSRPLDRRTAMLFDENVVSLKIERVVKDPQDGTAGKFHRAMIADERVAELRGALRAPLDRDESRPFTSSCPIDAARGGTVHRRYVDDIREYVQQQYRRRAPADQPPIIYDERVIERFEEAAIEAAGYQTEISRVVEESMELAELNLQHPKYSDIQPVNPRDGWWAFFNGAQDPNRWEEFKHELTDAVHAAAGRTGVTAPDRSQWLQEIEDPYMVILLRERAAYPTRIIRGYDIDERREKIHEARAAEGRVQEITPFARTGIRPKPPSQTDLRQAEQLFVGAVILGMFDYSQQRQEFSMELEQAQGMPRRLLALPADFGTAVSELAYRNETRTVIAQMIQNKINEIGEDKALETMRAVAGRIEITDGGEARTQEMARMGIRGLDDAQATNVIRGLEAQFQLIAPEDARQRVHPYADLVLDPPAGRRPGYYCRNRGCGIFLGPDLDSVPPECPNCETSFVPYTDG